jgi:hypothetical protein
MEEYATVTMNTSFNCADALGVVVPMPTFCAVAKKQIESNEAIENIFFMLKVCIVT